MIIICKLDLLGLCGAVHTGVARSIRVDLAADPDIKVVCVGDKSRAILSRLYGKHILFVGNEVIKLKFLNSIVHTIFCCFSFVGRPFATTIFRCI
jgi:F0F1-type ATP synthase gamma subunit